MITPVIASRTFYLVNEKAKMVTIEIVAPVRTSNNTSWECEVRILGAPQGLDRMIAGGNDSYQALAMGLSILQAMVYRYNKEFVDSGLRLFADDDQDLRLKVIQS